MKSYMKIKIISYSRIDNNKALAKKIASYFVYTVFTPLLLEGVFILFI